MFDAIILAGGENNKVLADDGYPSPYEALIEIAGKPMVMFVAEALAACPQVERIFIVGPARQMAKYQFPARTVILEGGRTIMETIRIGMAALGHQRPTLVATADIPLLTPGAVEDFLVQCAQKKADLYYPIITREANNRYYPGNKRTYVRLREGVYTGGNLFLVDPSIVPRCITVSERLISYRKNPLKLAGILGWKFVFYFLLGRLSLAMVVRRVSELLGVKGAVIISSHPEVGIDVDKPSDLELVRAKFSCHG